MQNSKIKDQSDFKKSIEDGKPAKKHTTEMGIKEKNSLDPRGEPDSSIDLLNPDGSVKQRRYYDENGKVLEDITIIILITVPTLSHIDTNGIGKNLHLDNLNLTIIKKK